MCNSYTFSIFRLGSFNQKLHSLLFEGEDSSKEIPVNKPFPMTCRVNGRLCIKFSKASFHKRVFPNEFYRITEYIEFLEYYV